MYYKDAALETKRTITQSKLQGSNITNFIMHNFLIHINQHLD